MLILPSFGGARFRVGAFAIGWLYATAFVIGLGLGPMINYFARPTCRTPGGRRHALTVLGMGAVGFAMSKDLAPWMRPLSLIVLGAVVLISLGADLRRGGALSPIISLIIFAASAALIMVDFNYLRKHGTEDDTVMLATASAAVAPFVNIFISLLNLFSAVLRDPGRSARGSGHTGAPARPRRLDDARRAGSFGAKFWPSRR